MTKQRTAERMSNARWFGFDHEAEQEHFSQNSTTMSSCKIFLFIPSDDYVASAEAVAEQLSAKYGVFDVTTRSAKAPVDRLLADLPPATGAILVFYSGSSAVTVGVMQEESSFPVLEVDASGEPSEIAWTIAKWCSLGRKSVAKHVHQATLEKRQAKLVEDAELQTKSLKYRRTIARSFDKNHQITGEKTGLEALRGKVRDRIEIDEKCLALVTTDRQSGFDRQLALVPFKGAVLNLTSAFWFEKTRHIIPNHVLSIPHPYVTIAKKCQPFPIEFVVR
jgi:hypothetical protein